MACSATHQLLVAFSSVQGAHVAAQNVANPQLSQFIISVANQSFTSGMAHALLVGCIVLVIASILNFTNNIASKVLVDVEDTKTSRENTEPEKT